MSNRKVFGLDLGTGNSCVAVIEGGKPQVIANADGSRTTPSVVYIKDDERKIGAAAKRGLVMNPKNTISFIKRFMGSDYNDADVQKMISMATYDVVDENGKPKIKIDDKTYSPEQISSLIIEGMAQTASDYYGEKVNDVVITCPAWFNDVQRNATKLAGELAGMNVLRVINEPTAAILASNIDTNRTDKIVLVTDIGAGTTDFSLCEVSDGMVEVLASHGDVFLGGQNYDNAIVEWMISEFKKSNGVDLSKDKMAYARLVDAAETAKIELSQSSSTSINLPYITMSDNGPLMLDLNLTKAKFEQLVDEFNTKVVECAKEAVQKAGKNANDIDEVLLVGGTTRIPSLQDALTKEFGKPLNKSVNPDEAVALGAAIQANTIVGGENASDVLLLDVTPISLGIETVDFSMVPIMAKIVDANTTIPTSKKQIFSTATDNQTGVDINVLQGERPLAKDNKLIGKFHLDGIAPAPKGVPQIEVSFDIDANGILSVSAMDKATGKEQHITVENNSLSDEEIEAIKADAEKFKEEDNRKRQELETINAAQSLSTAIRKMVDDKENKMLTDENREAIEPCLKTLEEALNDTSNVTAIKDALHALEEVYTPIISAAYNDSNPEQQLNPQDLNGFNPADMFNGGFNPQANA